MMRVTFDKLDVPLEKVVLALDVDEVPPDLRQLLVHVDPRPSSVWADGEGPREGRLERSVSIDDICYCSQCERSPGKVNTEKSQQGYK